MAGFKRGFVPHIYHYCVREREGYQFVPLISAVTDGHYDCVRALLKSKDVDVNVTAHVELGKTCYHKVTALWLAVKQRHLSIVQLLLRHGSDINVSDRFGNTCFMVACQPVAQSLRCQTSSYG